MAQLSPGIFFVGALGHGLDYRKSAGGFVHGFRYVVRATYRGLREQRHLEEWDSDKFSYSLDALTKRMLDRINVMAGPYQMIGYLSDIYVLWEDDFCSLYEEVPKPMISKFLERRNDFHKKRILGVMIVKFVTGKGLSDPLSLNRIEDPDVFHEKGPGHQQRF